MKLWLDDVRPAPDGSFTVAKTVGQAIALLQSGQVTFASLDYDVNWDEGGDATEWQDRRTGYAVVKWMADNKAWPIDGVAIHSRNVDGVRRMRDLMHTHGIYAAEQVITD